MLDANGGGTALRCAVTNPICLCASHKRVATIAASAMTNTSVNDAEVMCENEALILRASTMAQDANRLIWIDLEMTGLAPETDRIIEVALVVTDHDLKPVAVAPVWAVHQADATLAAMDAWNQSTHARSGLIERVK